MSTSAQFIVDAARNILRDVRVSAQRYSDQDYVDAINIGQRTMIHLNPDSNLVSENWQLVAGAKQTLPDDCAEFRALKRNMGIDGNTVGDSIIPVDRDAMDAADIGWYYDAPNINVIHSIESTEKSVYYVWPPQPTTVGYVEAEYVKIPADLTDISDNISVRDEFASALPYWCASYLLSQDNEHADSLTRAEKYSALFLAQLGIMPEVTDG